MIKCWVRAESKSMAESAAYDVDWTADNSIDVNAMGPYPMDSTARQDVFEVTITAKKMPAKKARGGR